MKVLILLALLGSALALQAPVEYEYKYHARVGAGVQSSRPQYSGTGLRATVKVTMDQEGEGTIEFKDVEVGEKNEVVPDNGRAELKIDYKPIEDKALQLPFKAHFRNKDGQKVMDVPDSDLLWVTNVRRGLANLFRIAPLVDPSSVRPPPSGGEIEPQAFSRIEDTYAGRCKVGYTFTPASSNDLPDKPTEDIQSRKARKGPGGRQVQLDDRFYRLQSSIDFSTCSDRVVLLQTGAGNLTNVTDSMYKDVSTRGAVSQHILKGSPGKFRIECAIMEHQLVMNPFGIDSDKMLVVSNQTLTLLNARHTSGRAMRPMPRMKQVDTWRHQLQSPHDRPNGYSPRWMTYKKENNDEFKPIFYERMTTGFKLTDGLQDSIKKRIEDKLRRAVDRLRRQNKDHTNEPMDFRGTEDGLAAQGLMDVHKLIRTLRSDKLRQLDQELKKDSSCDTCSKLFTEALAVAGSGPSIDLLLEKINNRELPDNKTAQIFFNIANNIHSPEVVEKLMKFAMSLDEENRVLVSLLAKVNLSILMRRLCVLPHVRTYSHMRYMYGSKMCDKSKIVQEYLPHLEAKITGSNELWVKILNVLAAGDLGLKESLDILEKVARGEINHDRFLRYSAIHSMSSLNFDNRSEDKIFNILQPIAESEVEDFRIRQVAYVSLLSFKPNATFLQRMVFSARQEPSTQIKSFINWIVQRLGKIDDPSFRPLSSAARNLDAFTQFISPSKYHAMNYLTGRYLHQDLIGSITDSAWLAGYTENFPREVYGFVAGKYGRFNIPLLETVTFGNTADLESKMVQWLQSYTNPGVDISPERQAHRHRIQQQFDTITRGQSSERADEKIADLYHYTRMWRTSEVFLPLTDDLYSKMEKTVKNFMEKLQTRQRVVMHRYFNPVELHVIMPLPAGLFMHVEVNTPTVLFADVDMEAFTPVNVKDLPILRSLNISADGIVKAITKLNTHAYIFGPWTNKTVSAAVDNEKSFSLPMKYEIATNLVNPSQIFWGELTPKFNQSSDKIPVIKIRNVPYTALSKKIMLPSPENSNDFENLKKVQWVYDDDQQVRITVPISKKYTGLNAEVCYIGEPMPPMRQPNIYDYIYEPSRLLALLASPTIKNYDVTLYRNPGNSDTKKIGFAYRHLIENGNGGAIKVPDSAKQPIDVGVDDTLEQRQEKLRQFSDKKVHEYTLKLNFTGAKTKKYEAALIMSNEMNTKEDSEVEDYLRKIQFAYLEKNDESDHKAKTCAVLATERPQLLPTSTIADLVKAYKDNFLVGKIATDVFEGAACSDTTTPIAECEGHLTVTDNRLQAIMNITDNGDFQYSETNEFYRLAVYDQLNLDVNWKEASMTLKNLTHRVKDLAEGFLFPKIVKNNFASNEDKKMKVSADRSISDDRADAWITLPKETCHAEQITVQPWFDYLTGFTPDEANNVRSRVHADSSVRPRDKCLLSKEKVTTYDGVKYNKMTSSCPVMASLLKAGDDKIVVIISDEERPTTVKISSVKDALDIRVTGKKIMVNDREIPESENEKEFKDESGNVLAKIMRRSSLVTVDFTDKLRVDIKRDSEVSIKANRRFRNSALGLCGDFDGEAQNDMRGSEKCIFKESMGDMYTASWVVQQDDCNDSAMKEMIDRCKEYAKDCDRVSGEQHSLSASDSKCKFDAYPVYKFENKICVSRDPISECTTSCPATGRVSKELRSKCWMAGQAPAEVKKYLSRGYLTERVDEQGHMETMKVYEVSEDCRERLASHPSQQWQGQDYSDRASVGRLSGDDSEDYQQYGDKLQSTHQSRQDGDKAGHDYEGDDQDVDRMRSHPRHRHSQVQGSSGASDEECYVKGYSVKRIGGLLCTTEVQSRFCKKECNVQDTDPEEFPYKCWREEDAPEEVKEAERDGYLEQMCTVDGQFHKNYVTQVSKRCSSPHY